MRQDARFAYPAGKLHTMVAMRDRGKHPESDLIEGMKRHISRVLQPLLPAPDSRIALIDFPNYGNVGDSAIWVGEYTFLQQHGFGENIYTNESRTYSKDSLADAVGDGTIFIHGGGNFGDLWPEHQELREQVVIDFPNNKIVQLPQSIYFREKENLFRARDIFRRHADLTVLVRDRASLEIAAKELGVNTGLCPDMAFWLGSIDVDVAPLLPFVWLYRNDRESLRNTGLSRKDGVWPYDWRVDEVTNLVKSNIELRYQYATRPEPQVKEVIRKQLSNIYTPVARERIARGCRVLACGRSVITERLHGHILCMLMGIPHYIIDTRFRKIMNFVETWEYKSPLMHWCKSGEEVLSMQYSRSGAGMEL